MFLYMYIYIYIYMDIRSIDIIIIILIIIVYISCKKDATNEGMANMAQNEEAIANTASIYNTGNMKVSNLQITDKLTAQHIEVGETFSLLPRGMIITWSPPGGWKQGDKIPTGWLLCDGSSGTPNLRGRFIRMASLGNVGWKPLIAKHETAHNFGYNYPDNNGQVLNWAIGDQVGSDSTLMHTDQMPGHNHGQYTNNKRQNNGEWAEGGLARLMVGDRGGGFWHNNFSGSAGGNQGQNNIPPSYVLFEFDKFKQINA
jgi:hypothetical protein